MSLPQELMKEYGFDTMIEYKTNIRMTNKNWKIITEVVKSGNMNYDEEGNQISGSGIYDIGITGDGYPSGKEKDCKVIFHSFKNVDGNQASLEDLKRLENMVFYRIGKKTKNL